MYCIIIKNRFLFPSFKPSVKLAVSGEDGAGSERKVNLINVLEGNEPIAEFFAEPFTGKAPFTVHFFDTSSGDVANHSWDFGDGNTSTEQNPVHTHIDAGLLNVNLFDVKLTVSNNDGADIEIKTNLITVEEGLDPTAGFIANDTNNEENSVTVMFEDLSSSPDETITEMEWDFGDDTKSNEENPEHTYTGSIGDSFTVSLTAQNAVGFDTVTKPSFITITSGIVPGFIKGKATDNDTGEVVPEAYIKINSADSVIGSVETTDDGLYFMQVLPGEYTMAADKEGFGIFSKDITVIESEAEIINWELSKIGLEDQLEVAKLQAEPEELSRSEKPTTVTVAALDEHDNPIQNVNITASARGRKVLVNQTSAVTDSDGKAEFNVQFVRFLKRSSVTFTANEISVTVRQN